MGYSINTYTYSGGPRVFDTGFALGVLDDDHIQVFVAGELDGLGEQIYRTFVYDANTEQVTVNDEIATGSSVTVQRTVPKDDLTVSFESGDDVSKRNLDRQATQCIMAAHEVLDGRISDINTIIDQTTANVEAAQTAQAAAEAAAAATESDVVDAELAQTTAVQAAADATAALATLSNEVTLAEAARDAAETAQSAAEAAASTAVSEVAGLETAITDEIEEYHNPVVAVIDIDTTDSITIPAGFHTLRNTTYRIIGERVNDTYGPAILVEAGAVIDELNIVTDGVAAYAGSLSDGASGVACIVNICDIEGSCRVGKITASLETGQVQVWNHGVFGGSPKPLVRVIGDGTQIGFLDSAGYSYAISVQNVQKFRLGGARITGYQKGVHIRTSRDVQLGPIVCAERFSSYSVNPGRNGLHISDSVDVTVAPLSISDSTEHAIYVSGGADYVAGTDGTDVSHYGSKRIAFSSIYIARAGRSGLKCKAVQNGAVGSADAPNEDIVTGPIHVRGVWDITTAGSDDDGASDGSGNADGIKIEHTDRCTIASLTVVPNTPGNMSYSCQYGATITSCRWFNLGNTLVSGCGVAGLRIRDGRGDSAQINIPSITVRNSAGDAFVVAHASSNFRGGYIGLHAHTIAGNLISWTGSGAEIPSGWNVFINAEYYAVSGATKNVSSADPDARVRLVNLQSAFSSL